MNLPKREELSFLEVLALRRIPKLGWWRQFGPQGKLSWLLSCQKRLLEPSRQLLFGVFCLSGSRFTSNQHRLILNVGQHVSVSSFCDSPQVRWYFISSFTKIHLNNSCGVNWVSF